MAAQKSGPAAPEVTPMEIQAREKALREKPPASSGRTFPKLTAQAPKHPKVFGGIDGAPLSYEDRIALCDAVVVAPGDGELIPPRALDWRKTRAAHDLGDGRFAVVLTNDFVIELVPEAPAPEVEQDDATDPEAEPEAKGKKGRKS